MDGCSFERGFQSGFEAGRLHERVEGEKTREAATVQQTSREVVGEEYARRFGLVLDTWCIVYRTAEGEVIGAVAVEPT
jgi:hypothetical protein